MTRSFHVELPFRGTPRRFAAVACTLLASGLMALPASAFSIVTDARIVDYTFGACRWPQDDGSNSDCHPNTGSHQITHDQAGGEFWGRSSPTDYITQRSEVGAERIEGTLEAWAIYSSWSSTGFAGYESYSGSTTMEIVFTVPAVTPFVFDGIQARSTALTLVGGDDWLRFDYDGLQVGWQGESIWIWPSPTPKIFEGVLLPGVEYRLSTAAGAFDPSSLDQPNRMEFELTMEPVPEPGTGLLLGAALAIVSARRRSHRSPEPSRH